MCAGVFQGVRVLDVSGRQGGSRLRAPQRSVGGIFGRCSHAGVPPGAHRQRVGLAGAQRGHGLARGVGHDELGGAVGGGGSRHGALRRRSEMLKRLVLDAGGLSLPWVHGIPAATAAAAALQWGSSDDCRRTGLLPMLALPGGRSRASLPQARGAAKRRKLPAAATQSSLAHLSGLGEPWSPSASTGITPQAL